MNFLLDENFPKAAYHLLVELGHSVIDIRGTEREGADDSQLFELAQQHQAIMLTTDKDFYHTVPILYPEHHGVIVVSLRQPNRAAILAKLRWVLAQPLIDEMQDTVLLLRDQTYRIRHKG